MEERADGGCVLVTGASSGIGRELALHLSKTHRVILNGRDEQRLEETRAQCERASEQVCWRYDLASVDGLAESLSGLLAAQTLRVAGFVHCAGWLKVLPIRSLTLKDVTDSMNTNCVSAFEITRVLMKKNVNERRLACVVFVSSIASMFGARGFSAYCAGKGALDAMMKALAVELAPGVRVNSVLPGGIRTAMTSTMFDDPEMVAKFERDYPLGIGEPADVIAMVEFLMSSRARWITGQQFVVDGGRTANITA